jgi:Fur family transcriptional regulator, ferric uptake regulator
MRHSKHRHEIVSTLREKPGAFSAAELHSLLPHINLVTIYRNLEQLAAAGDIKKMHLEGGVAVFEFQSHPHHHAVCSDCKKVIHFEAPDDTIKKLLGLEEFSITELELTVRGHCMPHTKTAGVVHPTSK